MFWYALRAKPRREFHVANQLLAQRVNVFLPLARVKTSARREEPFFPGYLFAQADLSGPKAAALRWTPGLHGLVEFGGEPAPVSEGFIGRLRARLEQIRAAGGVALSDMQRGDPITIVSGPLAGYEALFEKRLSGAERVRIMLMLVEPGRRQRQERRLPVEINVDHIRRARSERG